MHRAMFSMVPIDGNQENATRYLFNNDMKASRAQKNAHRLHMQQCGTPTVQRIMSRCSMELNVSVVENNDTRVDVWKNNKTFMGYATVTATTVSLTLLGCLYMAGQTTCVCWHRTKTHRFHKKDRQLSFCKQS